MSAAREIDKSKWPMVGEWNDEPDLLHFTTANGMTATIIRASSHGGLCGYVGVPDSHPWFGKEYSTTVAPTAEQLARPVDTDKLSIISLFCAAASGEDMAEGARLDCLVSVHGGLTYSDMGKAEFGEDPALWYFGFDCAHSGDLSPSYDRHSGHGSYRNIEYVKSEIESLATQLGSAQ